MSTCIQCQWPYSDSVLTNEPVGGEPTAMRGDTCAVCVVARLAEDGVVLPEGHVGREFATFTQTFRDEHPELDPDGE